MAYFEAEWVVYFVAESWRPLQRNIHQRYNQASIILSSQIPVSAWHDIIGNSTIADAVLDRI
ncbi:ATP-binding protein, partial [Flavobacterium azizsancarii]|uniref:ATP-binding protein n=1 Tax=Flavobacterium azizsancarii TaxID=2961580 RepID=UPI0030B84214